MRITYTFLFILFSCFCLRSQQELVLHTDKPYYITGETVWYELYLPVSFDQRQIALRALVTNPEGTIIEDYFLKSGGKGSVEGYYNIPFTLLSGVYQIHFYVSIEEGQEEQKLASFDIHIYNDLSPGKITKSGETAEAVSLNDLNVNISTSASAFNPMDEVKLDVSVTDRSGNPVACDVSLSVYDYDISGSADDSRSIQKELIEGDAHGY